MIRLEKRKQPLRYQGLVALIVLSLLPLPWLAV